MVLLMALAGVVLAVLLFVAVEKTGARLRGEPPRASAGRPAPPRPAASAQPRQRLLATAPWGGVLLECGPNKLILFVLPITDPEPYEAVAAFPPGLIEAVVVLNARQEGVLAGSLVARQAGTSRVYAVAPGPIDRGVPVGEARSAVLPGEATTGDAGTARPVDRGVPASETRAAVLSDATNGDASEAHAGALLHEARSGDASEGGAAKPVDRGLPASEAHARVLLGEARSGDAGEGGSVKPIDRGPTASDAHALGEARSGDAGEDGAAKPIDRGLPGADARTASPLSEARIGDGTVTLTSDGVRVAWDDGGLALVGDALPLAAFHDSGARQLAGAVAKDLGPSPSLFRAIPQQVVLLPNVPGADQRRMAQLLAQLGVSVTLAAAPPDPEQELIALLALGRLDEAEAKARARVAKGALLDRMHFQLGIAALMRRDEPAAIAAFEAAAQAGSAEACSSLAGLLAARGDRRALDFAKRALDGLPGDATALQSAIRAHLRLGDAAGARELFAAHRDALEVGDRIRVEAALDGKVDLDRGAHRFPAHAQLVSGAAQERRAAGDRASAEPLARRAVELDRDEPAHVAELGTLLSELGRDADAVAAYDEAIARGGVHELLRFNRGNCHLRGARYPQAVADYRACLALKDDWHEVRVNLASALLASKDRDAAKAELQKLKDGRAPGDFVAGVEQMLA